MILSCASKTFLLGEYLALRGEPCLLAATEPRFELRIESGAGENPFHLESPAGKLWALRQDLTKSWQARLIHPDKTKGLGGSSAEFLLLHAALQVEKALAWEAQFEPDFSRLLKDYQDLADPGSQKPSGADLVVQTKGLITLFDRQSGKVESRGWGLSDLSFLIFSTGVKVATHEHLAQMSSDWNSRNLAQAAQIGITAWLKHDCSGFVESVRRSRFELQQLGFEAPSTTKILGELVDAPEILAAKGCGALGGDTILILCDPADKMALVQELGVKMKLIATETELSKGLSLLPRSVGSEVFS